MLLREPLWAMCVRHFNKMARDVEDAQEGGPRHVAGQSKLVSSQ